MFLERESRRIDACLQRRQCLVTVDTRGSSCSCYSDVVTQYLADTEINVVVLLPERDYVAQIRLSSVCRL